VSQDICPGVGTGTDPDPDPSAPVADAATVLGRLPTGVPLRTELAAAARSRGHRCSHADALASLHDSLAAIDVPSVDLETPRKRLADATGETDRLKERVAAARGALDARRAIGADTTDARAELEAAAAALAEAETAQIAAKQALAAERERAARSRDERERRLTLVDRLANCRRDARAELAASVYPAFRDALAAIPGGDPAAAGTAPSEYAGPSLVGSLAAVRVAALSRPVVLEAEAVEFVRAWEDTEPAAVLSVPVTPEV